MNYLENKMGAFNELKNAIVCLSLTLYINVCVCMCARARVHTYTHIHTHTHTQGGRRQNRDSIHQ